MSQSEASAEPRFEGSVTAAFPLALLESVRSHDHPGEVLEDEDLSVSLPRRLGLTGVVETQIMRYEGALRGGRTASLNEVVSLIRLVMRRPDREPILRETGQRYARWRSRHRPGAWTAILHRAPKMLGLRAARRAAAAALRSIHAGDPVDAAKPFTIRLGNSLTTRVAAVEASGDTGNAGNPGGAGNAGFAGGAACTLVTGLLEELLLLATGQPHRVAHSDCIVHGAAACEWILLEQDA